jgi:TolB protein
LAGGGLIAFSARIEGNWDIYAARLDGEGGRFGKRIRLTADPAEDRYPAFSPDGRTLAFSSRRDGFWNLYALTPDGAVVQLTDDPAYDGAPAWSPDGKRVAFESMRAGNLDIWVIDLEGGDSVPLTAVSGSAANLTADSPRGDCDPVWSPDGSQIAFTSWRYGDQDIFVFDLQTGQTRQLTFAPTDEHLFEWWSDGELVYTAIDGERQDAYSRTASDDPEAPDKRLTYWSFADAPSRAPDGTYLATLNRQAHGSRLYLQRPEVAADLPIRLTEALPIVSPLSWTETTAPWREAHGEPVVFYQERTTPGHGSPYDLKPLDGITVNGPWLADRVDDSFYAMRQRVIAETGHDFLANLSDAWRVISHESDRSAYMSWHKTGRAIDTLMDYLSPDHRQRWLEVALEPGGGEIFWRLYLRCQKQDGSQGMPLKVRPWDLTADARQNLQGGYRKPVPGGYYVDLTDLMAQYGWYPIAAHERPDFHWHTHFLATEYWHFQKTDGLLWYDAMLEVFPAERVETYYNWQVLRQKGTPLWLAAAKGIPLPWKERRMLDMLAR